MSGREWYLRDHAIRYALSFIGTPYEYGDEDHTGMDCSGFVSEVMQATGKLRHRQRLTSWQLINTFPVIWDESMGGEPRAKKGAIIGYGSSKVTHVMLALDEDFCIGASGGTSKTDTPAEADAAAAFVMQRPITYRKDILYIVDPFKEIDDA